MKPYSIHVSEKKQLHATLSCIFTREQKAPCNHIRYMYHRTNNSMQLSSIIYKRKNNSKQPSSIYVQEKKQLHATIFHIGTTEQAIHAAILSYTYQQQYTSMEPYFHACTKDETIPCSHFFVHEHYSRQLFASNFPNMNQRPHVSLERFSNI